MSLKLIEFVQHPIAAATTNIIVHGNSYSAGLGSSGASARWTNVASTLPPLNSTPISNQGVNGQSIATLGTAPSTMIQTAPAAVDANLVAGKKNILVAWEGANEYAQNGLDPVGVLNAYKDYCLLRRAAAQAAGRDLYIIVGDNTWARSSTGTDVDSVTRNLGRKITNNLLRDHFREFADQYHPVCDFEPFASMAAAGTFTQAEFAATGLWARSDGQANDWSHFGDVGYSRLAFIWAQTFRRVRK